MAKAPRIPGETIVAEIRQRVLSGEREPFADILADALSVAPSKTALRQLARQNPRQFVSMLKELAELTGYASRHESVTIKHDARSMALELVNRVGPERAKAILRDFNLPESLVTPANAAQGPIGREPIDQQGIHGERPAKPHTDARED
jgi:hypothetical protein